jgi:hypothetical protein
MCAFSRTLVQLSVRGGFCILGVLHPEINYIDINDQVL